MDAGRPSVPGRRESADATHIAIASPAEAVLRSLGGDPDAPTVASVGFGEEVLALHGV